MNWTFIKEASQLSEINERSTNRPQVIFKHSIRCGISSVAKNRLEKAEKPGHMDFWCLDLINYRSLSNKVVELYKVRHESPQILVIRNGECVYDESHLGISMKEIAAASN